MPLQEIIEAKSEKSIEKDAKLKLAINCAPLLKGSKAANIMTVTLQEFYVIKELLKNTGIACYLLKGKSDNYNLYLYRESKISAYMKQPKVKTFMQGYGYDTDDFSKMLVRLSVRCKEFWTKSNEFPHEIGAFLDYPIEDVQSFIDNKGESFSFVGYWKVYHNQTLAKKRFQRFDQEREIVIREILDGLSLTEIVC